MDRLLVDYQISVTTLKVIFDINIFAFWFCGCDVPFHEYGYRHVRTYGARDS
jgi:hypothetical protein